MSDRRRFAKMDRISQKGQQSMKKGLRQFKVNDIFKRSVDIIVDEFISNPKQIEYKFPNTLSSAERGYIHIYVRTRDLKSKSYGKDENRYLTIFKSALDIKKIFSKITITSETHQRMVNYLKNSPVTDDDQNELKNFTKRNIKPYFECTLANTSNRHQLTKPIPVTNSPLTKERMNLPIFNFRKFILDVIESNQVTVISAETGAGKSTQVPQYILEQCAMKGSICRIVCTQPRRVAAIAVAHRVAQERNEIVGLTVGYQIRLESQMSPTSNLIYTTTGYFLRCLVGGDVESFFRDTTHIILDEIHERDKHSDFVLIAIKEHLHKHPNTKVILMSATIDSRIFSNYFNGCPVVEVPGRLFPVKMYHLEDILRMTKKENCFKNTQMEIQKSSQISKRKPSTEIIDRDLMNYVNEILEVCWCSDDPTVFDQFFYLVSGENVPIDIKHSETSLTALMIAAGKGLPDVVSTLLEMGADPNVLGAYKKNACEWAQHMQNWNCVTILQEFDKQQRNQGSNNTAPSVTNDMLLNEYSQTINDDEIDHQLMSELITYIHTNMPPGSILVFISGYDDIIEQRETLLNHFQQKNLTQSIEILQLHSSMQVVDQRKVFQHLPHGIRKVILSTNIAETSITIDDVVYVIDSGKVKQKSFDAITGSTSLTSVWISQACATQRMGRAGRTKPGICYRLFSKSQYDKFDEFTLPEILRVPLPEICLHAKILSIKSSIAEFLANAIQPPPTVNIEQSVQLLQNIGALDFDENITELGMRLVDLPLDVQLSKVLLYSIFFKCLDPVLTIVSTLSVKDPFILPNLMDDNRITISRRTLSEETLSDHMVFLKLFKSWMEAKVTGKERQFCWDTGISNGTMELICGTRSHILGCLRSHKIASNSLNNVNVNSSNWSVVKACLTAGLYPNICRIDRNHGKLRTKYENKLAPHPSAAIRDHNPRRFKQSVKNLPVDWLVFGEKIRNDQGCLLRYNSMVSSLCVALFCGPYYLTDDRLIVHENSEMDSVDENDNDENDECDIESKNISQCTIAIDDWIELLVDTESAYIIQHFRHKINVSFLKMLRDIKSHTNSKIDAQLLNILCKILQYEDQSMGLTEPNCVGFRPVAVKLNFGADLNFGIKTSPVPSSMRNEIRHHPNVNYSSNNGQNCVKWDRRQLNSTHFIKNSRYFIVRAINKKDVQNALRDGMWNFSKQLLLKLLDQRKKRKSIRIILIFFVPMMETIFGIGELVGDTEKNFGIQMMSEHEVHIREPRKELPNHSKTISKLIPPIAYLEEIDDKDIVRDLLKVFLK